MWMGNVKRTRKQRKADRAKRQYASDNRVVENYHVLEAEALIRGDTVVRDTKGRFMYSVTRDGSLLYVIAGHR